MDVKEKYSGVLPGLVGMLLWLWAIPGQAQGVYDTTMVHRIDVVFAQSNWDYMLDTAKAGAEGYIMAQSVTIDGVAFDSVGVKYKGNSSYNANQVKNPWHIELDTYKDQDYQGFVDFKLSNVAKDPSYLREVLSYQIARQYMVAPQSNYVMVYVNGSLLGLYVSSESIGKRFVNSYLGSKTGTFVKCNPVDGAGPTSTDLPTLEYLGPDSADYYASYEMKSDAGWSELLDLIDTLNHQTGAVEALLDVDQVLWMHALNNVLVNMDSYSGQFAQNYYLYRRDHRRFYPIIWDLNESLGGFAMTGTAVLNSTSAAAQLTPLLHVQDAQWPLIQQLLNQPMYRRMYLAHMKTIVEENFSNGNYFVQALYYHQLIDTAVAADANGFYSYNDFVLNLTSDVVSGGGPGGPPQSKPGIEALMDARASYLLATSELSATQPTISNIVAPSPTLLPASGFVTATVSNASAVYLSSRSNAGEYFNRVPMLDDGMHGDGAANDGVYGAPIQLTGAHTEYYLYADGAAIGRFAPERAAHRYYSIDLQTTTTGLVINELMASNDATLAASDGEFYDWIELYNSSNEAIFLGDYGLSDDLSNPAQYLLPSDSLGPGSFALIWASDLALNDPYHAPFKLSKSGEELALFADPLGSASVVDYLSFAAQTTDVSFGRSYDAGPNWVYFSTPTPLASNGTLSIPVYTKPGMKVYPNPFHELLTLENPTDELLQWQLYDMRGVLVHSGILEAHSSERIAPHCASGPLLLRYFGAQLQGSMTVIRR